MIRTGDCVDLMAGLEPCSADAVVCDPPYGLEFMGKEWDRLIRPTESTPRRGPDRNGVYNSAGRAIVDRYLAGKAAQTWHEAWASEALRVLKPGGHLLAFGGTRTSHRLACAVEDAGFEIRDTICWLYGSGFPKSLNLNGDWQGWGTALKPAHEPIVVARKPLGGTVAGNVLEHGTGALNVDGCRIEGHVSAGSTRGGGSSLSRDRQAAHGYRPEGKPYAGESGHHLRRIEGHAGGRWPANVALDSVAAGMLDEQSGRLTSGSGPLRRNADKFRNTYGEFKGTDEVLPPGDSGGASRFFYVAKASRAERNAGLEDDRNHHPTVKPVSLMRWLVRLVTPPEGLVLDPFAGSGTTGIAAILEGFRFLGMERNPEYAALAEARIGWWAEHGEDALRIVAERERAETERQEIVASGQLDLLG